MQIAEQLIFEGVSLRENRTTNRINRKKLSSHIKGKGV